MKCEKSFKRHMIKSWGISQLGEGKSPETVSDEMRTLARRSIPQIKLFLKERREAST